MAIATVPIPHPMTMARMTIDTVVKCQYEMSGRAVEKAPVHFPSISFFCAGKS
jgi:hypothetical protein